MINKILAAFIIGAALPIAIATPALAQTEGPAQMIVTATPQSSGLATAVSSAPAGTVTNTYTFGAGAAAQVVAGGSSQPGGSADLSGEDFILRGANPPSTESLVISQLGGASMGALCSNTIQGASASGSASQNLPESKSPSPLPPSAVSVPGAYINSGGGYASVGTTVTYSGIPQIETTETAMVGGSWIAIGGQANGEDIQNEGGGASQVYMIDFGADVLPRGGVGEDLPVQPSCSAGASAKVSGEGLASAVTGVIVQFSGT